MPKIKSTCEHCGIEIEHYPSQPRRWCSHACRVLGDGMPTKPKTGKMLGCPVCGTEFWVTRGELGTRKHCSHACSSRSQERRSTNICEQCGKSFEVKLSQAGLKSCSRECYALKSVKRPLDRTHNGKPAALDHQGYVRIYEPDHPRATRSGWIFEHRWIVEQALGRYLDRSENVHHLNHIRHDNRPENLQLLSHSEHSTITGRENGEALQAALDARQKLAEYERRFGPLEPDPF